MTINVKLPSPQLRNVIAEVVIGAGILNTALPELAKVTHVPTWVSGVLVLTVNIGNQILKQYSDEKTPSTPVPPAAS